MPTPRSRRTLRSSTPVSTRARYARTSGDMLTGGWDPTDGINPSDQPPIWWVGLDHGGGAFPIGPNGPWATHGPAQAVVTRGSSLITSPLTAAAFKVVELGFGGRPLPRPRWITDPMLLRPDSRFVDDVFPAAAKLGRGNFFADWIRSAIWWGTGAFLCQEDEFGAPKAGTLKLVNPHMLSCERSSDDNSLRWVIGAEGAQPEDRAVFSRDGRLSLGPITYKVVALRNPHSGVDVDGHSMGAFEMHPDVYQLGSQINAFESGTFRSGIPAGYLKVDSVMDSMTQEQAEDLKQRWMSSHGGDRRSIAVLNSFTSFVPLNLSPVDAALGEVKRLNIGSVAYSLGLDPEVLGVTMSNSGTYKNAQEFWQRHRDFGLSAWVAAVEDVLTALLPARQGVRVDLDHFANPTPAERYAGYAVAIDSGVLTPDECREMEGLEPLAGGSQSADQARALSQQEAVQKVYLGVTNGVISVEEARAMINDAGGHLDVDAVPAPAASTPPEPPAPTDIRSRRPQALR